MGAHQGQVTRMKRHNTLCAYTYIMYSRLISLFFLPVALYSGITLPLLAVDVDEDNKYVIIETQGYNAYWNKPAQMGYMQVYVGNGEDSIIGTDGRAFYHSSDYSGGWKDWGALLDWEIVDEGGGKAVVRYESRDGGGKEYTCVATYYDSVPYIKHEVTVTATGAVTSFQSGHEPMFEVNTDVEGMMAFNQPFPHTVYWVENGYFGAIYGPDAQRAEAMEWGERNPGRMHLLHDNLGKQLKKGDSATITYYVAFGEGDEKDATALAEDVQKEPGPGRSVSTVGKLTTTWGRLRARY
jgi:hypothetical protein